MHDVWRLLEDLIHQEPSFQPLIQLPLVPKVRTYKQNNL